MAKIILVNVPYTVIGVPPLALGVLKGAVESQGHACEIIDFGMDLFNRVNRDRSRFDELQTFFVEPRSATKDSVDFIEKIISQWAQGLVDARADWIGISIFSYYSHYTAFRLCEMIKQFDSKQKIVIGGPGTDTKIYSPLIEMHAFSQLEKMVNFGKILEKRQLADRSIMGDGEQALIDLLEGSTAEQEFNMMKYSAQETIFANFDGLHLDDYPGQLNRGHTQLPIFSSKGCVRDCDFCDVNTIQQKFRSRLGENIVKEMKYLADKYGLRDFLFLDSLVNGNLKSLKTWVSSLAEFNQQNPHKKITWSAGGWICRPIGQMPLQFYPMLAQSGLQSVSIGAESGSDHVLESMNKKTNVDALYFETEQFVKNDIKFILLMLIGHWSERWTDFVETCHLMENMAAYARSGHLVAIAPGSTFLVIEDIPADLHREKNGIKKFSPKLWHSVKNPELTVKERYFRHLLFLKLIATLGLPVMENSLYFDYEWLRNNINDIKKFNDTIEDYHKQSTAEYYVKNFDQFLRLVHDTNPRQKSEITLSLDLTVNVSNETLPNLEIYCNGVLVMTPDLQPDKNQISLTVSFLPYQQNMLEMVFTGKMMTDTVIDPDGNIVADKNILIDSFQMNNIDLMKDPDVFYNHLRYEEDGVQSTVKPGFWMNNSRLILEFNDPFVLWYNSKSTKNRVLDAAIVTESTVPMGQSSISKQPDLLEKKITELLSTL